MKNIFKTSALFGLLFVITSCEKDEEKIMLNANTNVQTTLSTDVLVLDKSKAEQPALTITWETQNLNLKLSHNYTIVLESNGKHKEVSVTKSPFTFTNVELNKILRNDLELPAGAQAQVNINIKDAVSDRYSFPTTATSLKVTPYADLIAPTEWGVVGDLTGWKDNADIPFWKIIGDDQQTVTYVTLEANKGFKIRKEGAWDKGGNLGAKEENEKQIVLGVEKVLYNDGGSKDMFVTENGAYRILFNESKLSIKVEKYSWSIIGDGAKGWNAGDDIPLVYDGTTNTWKATNVTLKNGGIKFRFDNKWEVSWGDKNNDGVLDQESDNNIKVSAGTYTITVDFSSTPPTYVIK